MTNASTLALCDMVKPHLNEGSRMFTSKSVVVAIDSSQPLPVQLSDINFAMRQLAVLSSALEKMKP
jgi:hypothetical protein